MDWMESSYREQLGNRQFVDGEIDVVVQSTLTLLRRHNVAGKLCPYPRCGNDDPESCSVTKIDNVGFITEVKCERCERTLSTICRNPRCRYEAIEDPSSLVPGDHITWHRPYLVWHHAVVMEQDLAGKEITVHEYTLSDEGPYAAIVQTKLSHEELVLHCYITLYRVCRSRNK